MSHFQWCRSLQPDTNLMVLQDFCPSRCGVFFFCSMDSANQYYYPYALVIMGVSGCGKSSVAQMLGQRLGWTVYEGDVYHPDSNIRKMQAGVALTDHDRQGWLSDLARLLSQATVQKGMVLTCSALKHKYREQLRSALPAGAVGFVFLDLSYAMALERVQSRQGHFFSADLVANQFQTLERPDAEAGVLTVNATQPLSDIVQSTTQWLDEAAPQSY